MAKHDQEIFHRDANGDVQPTAPTTPLPISGASSDAVITPEGYEQITSLAAAASLTPPAGADRAFIQALTQNVRWRDDGTSPTATVGIQLANGEEMWYSGDLTTIEFIEEAASAELNVSYYSVA